MAIDEHDMIKIDEIIKKYIFEIMFDLLLFALFYRIFSLFNLYMLKIDKNYKMILKKNIKRIK